MYVLVHHRVNDPDRFWSIVQDIEIPDKIKLHQSFPTPDGLHATCVWEGDSVDSIRDFVEPLVGRASVNDYHEAVNRDGIAMPSKLAV